jgi:drug/metabolite transporter (DMT)-like permease
MKTGGSFFRIAPISSIKELPWLFGVIVFGGVAGPVLLMYGLERTPASSASLLLNLEGVFTAVLAWLVFKEHCQRRIVVGMIAITLGGVVLSGGSEPTLEGLGGPIMVIGACLSWALDNNLTRKISLNDPILLTMVKSLAAGVTNFLIALGLGAKLPAMDLVLASGLLGFVCYGLSIVCFILALRSLGAARTGAYFSTAPFIGASVAVVFLREPLTWNLAIAAALMIWGLYLHLTEAHDHLHVHEELDHEHSHVHDDHHQHDHESGLVIIEPHTHRHVHQKLMHSHPHFPDMHHHHKH